ncbi:hypothetical protein, partial [Escherichia coli]|uniref:hypothetical protein n=1 Tax=Escherichia coli TaxID=562 RepID=UPI000BDA9CF4
MFKTKAARSIWPPNSPLCLWTPIYGMAKVLVARGQSVRLIYGAKSRAQMAFSKELQALLGDGLEAF